MVDFAYKPLNLITKKKESNMCVCLKCQQQLSRGRHMFQS